MPNNDEQQIEAEAIAVEGTDLSMVLMSEADELPQSVITDEMTVAAMQERISAEGQGQGQGQGPPAESYGYGVPDNPNGYEPSSQESKEQTRILLSINKYLSGITILLGVLVIVAMATMIMISASFR